MSDFFEDEEYNKIKQENLKFNIELKQSYKDVFLTDTGKKVLRDMILASSIGKLTPTTDPLALMYNSGNNDTVFRLLKMLDLTIESLIK